MISPSMNQSSKSWFPARKLSAAIPPGWCVDSCSVLFFLHQPATLSFSKGRRSFIFPLKGIKRKANHRRRRKRERKEKGGERGGKEKGKEGHAALGIRTSALGLGESLQAGAFSAQAPLPALALSSEGETQEGLYFQSLHLLRRKFLFLNVSSGCHRKTLL